MAFSFGGGDTGATGFSWGAATGASTGSTPSFSFGGASTSTAAPSSTSFAFGAPTTSTTTTTAAPATTSTFSFSLPSSTTTAPAPATTAPASSLFSFSTPATTTTTATATTSTAPSTFAFGSFGADTGASTTTTTAPTTTSTTTAPTSFGFGGFGADTGAASTSTLSFSLDNKPAATSSTTTTTAPTTTDAFNFAAPAAGSTASTASTATASTISTATLSSIDPSSRIKSKTMDEIINMWSRDLEDHVASFTEQALEVKKWDQQMIENLNKIVRLQHSVTNVQASQVKLNRILETIKINQQDLTTMIDNLEKSVDTSSKRNLTPDEMKREEAYRLAEEIDSQLMVMSDSLQETVTTLNSSAERHADPNNPFTQILKILNIQMTSLQWIEQTSHQLEGELQQASAAVRSAKLDTRNTANGIQSAYRR